MTNTIVKTPLELEELSIELSRAIDLSQVESKSADELPERMAFNDLIQLDKLRCALNRNVPVLFKHFLSTLTPSEAQSCINHYNTDPTYRRIINLIAVLDLDEIDTVMYYLESKLETQR